MSPYRNRPCPNEIVLPKVMFPPGDSLYPTTSQIQGSKARALCLNLGNLWRIIQTLTRPVRSSEAVLATTLQLSTLAAQICFPCSLTGVVPKAPQHICIHIPNLCFPRILNCDGWYQSPGGQNLKWDIHFWIHPESHLNFKLQVPLGHFGLLWSRD